MPRDGGRAAACHFPSRDMKRLAEARRARECFGPFKEATALAKDGSSRVLWKSFISVRAPRHVALTSSFSFLSSTIVRAVRSNVLELATRRAVALRLRSRAGCDRSLRTRDRSAADAGSEERKRSAASLAARSAVLANT